MEENDDNNPEAMWDRRLQKTAGTACILNCVEDSRKGTGEKAMEIVNNINTLAGNPYQKRIADIAAQAVKDYMFFLGSPNTQKKELNSAREFILSDQFTQYTFGRVDGKTLLEKIDQKFAGKN